VKNKETYAVAKSLLDKYGEKITPDARSPLVNSNNNGIRNKLQYMSLQFKKSTFIFLSITDLRQRPSIKPALPGSEKTPVSGINFFFLMKEDNLYL